jgi:phenylpropionate dioxygenase-like ring-hydroxylating dioxygenase large terminal subunit
MMQTERPWPLNAWYLAAWTSEIGAAPLARTLLNENIVLFRGRDGKIAALEDRCCHRAAPLSMGTVAPNGLQCGYHGMVFDPNGRCVSIPGQDSIPPQARVRSYPIQEQKEFVWIWMGDAAKADPAEIVEFPPKDARFGKTRQHGMVPLRCNYMLLVDNLMDLTHIPFVHGNTIGGRAQLDLLDARVNAQRTARGVHFIRWTFGHTPPPFFVKILGLGPEVRIDRWQEFEYVAPMSVLQWSGGLESGRGAEREREQPGCLSLRLYHGATPETDDSCFYFWMRARSLPDDAASADLVVSEMKRVFAQDVAILEGQNARLKSSSELPLVDTKNDAHRLIARRVLERMISTER